MDRSWHMLRSLKGGKVPEVCVFVDTEAWDTEVDETAGVHELTFRLGVATVVWLRRGIVEARQTVRFAVSGDFWRLLDNVAPRRGVCWVFAHNLGFDFTLLGGWKMLEGADVTIRSIVLEDPPSLLTYSRARRVYHWVDTLNYWRLPLSTLGHALGLEKLARPAQAASAADWFQYCQRDVEIIEVLICSLLNFVTMMLACSFQSTAAALSFAAWRRCSSFPSIQVHGNYRALSLERAALFGGRLECMGSGFVAKPVTALDVTSLYPYVMCSQPLPHALISLIHNPRKADLHAWLREYAAVAEVILDSQHPAFPQRAGHGTRYGRSAGRYVLCDPELRQALATASVRHVCCCALYATRDLFSGFIRPLLRTKAQARSSGRLAEELCVKLLLNSLSGKFAQKGRKWVNVSAKVATGKWGFWWGRSAHNNLPVRFRAVAGVPQQLVEGREPYNTFPAVSAFIASHGRCLLQEYRDLAGEASVLYCDTDSLHCLPSGTLRLDRAGVVDPVAVGRLRITHQGEDAYYWGLKNYRIGSHRVLGCVASSAREVADGIFQQDSFAGIQETLRTGNLDRIVVTERLVRLSDMSYQARRQLVPEVSDL